MENCDDSMSAEGTGALLLPEVSRASAAAKTAAVRNNLAFWFLGLLNNTSYVVMMAFAKDILPGAVGIVFLVNIFPTMLLKVSAPYW